MAKSKKPSVEEIIQRAVAAQRIASERQAKDTFKATEKRLYAYPVIQLKIEDDRERIEEINNYGAPSGSKSVIKHQRSGMRLTPEEIAEALITDLRAEIARNECELETIDRAILVVDSDPYAAIVKYKYFEGKNDEEIGEIMNCDPRTIRRQKSRLVGRLAVFLYGVTAVT
jgi:DNA-directed RNA polymerase specialized sigma24 family protein